MHVLLNHYCDLLKDSNKDVKKTQSTPRSKPKCQLSSTTPVNNTTTSTCLAGDDVPVYPDYNQPFIVHTDASADG